jgi:chaperonin GroEL
LQFSNGYMNPNFVTNQDKMICVLEEPLILFSEYKINTMNDVLPALTIAANAGKPLLIIADDYEGEALATLVVNKMRGAISVVAVRAPSYGEQRKMIMEDMAILTKGAVVTEDKGVKLQNITAQMMGVCKRVTVTKETTTILNGYGEKADIDARVVNLKAQIENLHDDNPLKTQVRERLAKISGGIAVIYVGGPTDTEMRERKDRIEDALFATKAAVAEGIIPGGGLAYLHARTVLNHLDLSEDQMMGVKIIKEALTAPLLTIVRNASLWEDRSVIKKIMDYSDKHDNYVYGYNAKDGKYEDLIAAGIIDPTKVARLALENAASIAGLLLTTRSVVIERPVPPQTQQ